MPFEPVIGLEIHAQLLTQTKIFCGCSTRFGAPPNTHICPVCLGLAGGAAGAQPPGGRAGDARRRTRSAARSQPRSIFARKNYFYPDLPKGYQISQYERPLATAGRVEYRAAARSAHVGITRVHLEEDAGKSLHDGFADSDRFTYLDFNRSGVPLDRDRDASLTCAPLPMPRDFFSRLREILVAIGVNDGNMEEGSLRCDANVSVRPVGHGQRSASKAEVKNLNSFRHVQRALEFEIARQTALLESGGRVVQETRLWDTGDRADCLDAQQGRSARLPLFPGAGPAAARRSTRRGSTGSARRCRNCRTRGAGASSRSTRCPEYDAGVLTQSAALADYFEATAAAAGNAKAASNWVMGELAAQDERDAARRLTRCR